MLPLLLPRPLLWLLLQLPAAKHHGPKGRTESKIYVLRSERPFTKSLLLVRKVSLFYNFINQFFTLLLLLLLDSHAAAATATAAALAAAAAPGSKTPWP